MNSSHPSGLTASSAEGKTVPDAPEHSLAAMDKGDGVQGDSISLYSAPSVSIKQEDDHYTEESSQLQPTLREQLSMELERYPGAPTWAPEEQILFERLFMREELPILPGHWEVDLRGIPIAADNFALDDPHKPLIYAHSKEFQATTALIRLVDLTCDVRTLAQSGLSQRVALYIKKGLDQYLAWAAEDGGYSGLQIVPNIVAEVVDPQLPEAEITEYIEGRMRALARLQQDYLLEDRKSRFWDINDVPRQYMTPKKTLPVARSLLVQKYLSPRGKKAVKREQAGTDELASDSVSLLDMSTQSPSADAKRRRTIGTFSFETDELAGNSSTLFGPERTPPSSVYGEDGNAMNLKGVNSIFGKSQHLKSLPVVYGLFIIGGTVLVLTKDSKKDDDSYISFHVEVDFMDKRQSVWNALTIGMIACTARDDLRSRIEDFNDGDYVDESDPDI